MNINQILHRVIDPFSIIYKKNDAKIKTSLDLPEKILAIGAGIIGLLGAFIGGPIAFYTVAFLLRERKIKQLENDPNSPINNIKNQILDSNNDIKVGITENNIHFEYADLQKTPQIPQEILNKLPKAHYYVCFAPGARVDKSDLKMEEFKKKHAQDQLPIVILSLRYGDRAQAVTLQDPDYPVFNLRFNATDGILNDSWNVAQIEDLKIEMKKFYP